MLKKNKLINLMNQCHSKFKGIKSGALADYIPELSKVDPKLFGISITDINGETIDVGDSRVEFTLQSVSKPFVFAMAMENYGIDHVRSRVGVEPTG